MRLHPEATEEAIVTWLKEQVISEDPAVATAPDLDAAVRSLAEAMAAISQVVLPEELEPLFP